MFNKVDGELLEKMGITQLHIQKGHTLKSLGIYDYTE